MREARLGPLDVVLAGGTDREGGGEGPLVVLLHGFGAPGRDLVPIHRALDVPSSVRWAFPAAPLSLPAMGFGMDSRAWWMIDMVALERAMMEGRHRDLSRDTPEGMVEAREKVLATLDALDAELSPSQVVIGGFSQGAMLSLDVALHSERPLAGLIHWSGTLLSEDAWRERLPSRAGLKVVQSHGAMDPLLPFAAAERLRDMMGEAGLEVDFVPFRGAHEIPGTVLQHTQALLRDVLA